MSPRRKRLKINSNVNNNKRENEAEDAVNKRLKANTSKEDELQAMKRKNFVSACEQVSYKSYFDHRSRLLLIYTPACIKHGACKHHDIKKDISSKEMPGHAEESFKIEAKTNMWLEALEVCQLCITPTQYLSANVLKEVVEIMMNAHEDDFSGYTVRSVIDKCQQILCHNFTIHTPCISKSLRKCYNIFLTSPMDPKTKTFTNRSEFECNKGIVKYCINRLKYEMSSESKDGPLVDKFENTPKEMQQSVEGLHWQKEKFEIFELLNRTERIERLMAVLESIVELLQFDLAIWQSRYTSNLGCHIMRSHRPLMAFILWSNNIVYTGAVTYNCRQILWIFVNMVHLKYSEKYIKIMVTWLNAVIQTFYICETNSNSDYPNIGKYCTQFANEFYKIISAKPQESILRILEHIQPTYMQHLIGLLHVQNLLSTNKDCIIKILIHFLNEACWKNYEESESEIQFTKKLFLKPKKIQNKSNYLSKKLSCLIKQHNNSHGEETLCPKLYTEPNEYYYEVNLNIIVHAMYITLESYLDAYSVQSVQETWDSLNEQLMNNCDAQINMQNLELNAYSVTENFIKKYRYIYQKLKELMLTFKDVKTRGELPRVMSVFENICLLEL